MTKIAGRTALRARIVFPIASPPIRDGVVTIEGDRIVAVGQHAHGTPITDLGNVALLPGLINCHTHLEFSELDTPVGMPGMLLPEWIATVVTQRRAEAGVGLPISRLASPAQAFRTGMSQCLRTGVTVVGNVATPENSAVPEIGVDTGNAVPLRWDNPLRCFEFFELIGLSQGRVAQQVELAKRYLASPLEPSRKFTRGLSPHAPYTAAPELVRQVVELSNRWQLTVAMHLAESREELRLLTDGSGPFRELLQRFEVWDEGVFPGGRKPHDYLRLLQTAHRCLIVHGNFLGAEDWALLAGHRATMSVVYCPRTHNYFGHSPYPLERMLQAGVRVVLGTDSRASNPDLNLFKEYQFVTRCHENVDPQRLLHMITLDAAAALGCAEQVGSLECGKVADLVAVQLGESATNAATDPFATILADDAHVCATWLGGSLS